jgi:hypothetical protein
MLVPTKIIIETCDFKLIKHLFNCESRQTNFRVHTRQFRVVRSDIERIKEDGEEDSHLYTYELQEVVSRSR